MILRRCRIEDLELLEKWDSPEDNMWPGDKRKYLEDRVNNPSYVMVIGQCHYGIPVAWGCVKGDTLSWFVAPNFRKQGYGLELVKQLLIFADLPPKAKINQNRLASEALAKKLGMRLETGEILKTGERWWILN